MFLVQVLLHNVKFSRNKGYIAVIQQLEKYLNTF